MVAPMKPMQLLICTISQYSRTILALRSISSWHTIQNNAHFSLNTHISARKSDASILTKLIPMKLKRPGNSFGLFMADVRKQLNADNPDKSFTETSKMLSVMWKDLPESNKERYRERAAKIREEFKQQFEYYKANLTENHIKELLQLERNKIKRRRLKKGKEEMKELEKPKRFSGPFAFYARAKLAQMKADGAVINRAPLSDVSIEWKMVDEEQKLAYKELAKLDMERYLREMEVWEKRMEQQGRHDLLRKKKKKTKKDGNRTEIMSKPKNNTWSHSTFRPDTNDDDGDKDVF